MTLLVIDIGNTRIKWATFNDDQTFVAEPAVHKGKDLAHIFSDCWLSIDKPTRVFASCVAGKQIQNSLAKWVMQNWDRQTEFLVTPKSANGLTNAYVQSEQLGSDRWAAMVEAFNQYNSPVCVVNCGSAVTLDLIDDRGLHMGGLIVPGLSTMRNSLLENTDLELDQFMLKTDFELGKTTQDCFMTGTLFSIAGIIERAIRYFEEEKGGIALCVLSGGDADILSVALDREHKIDKDLVLKGLIRIAKGS